MTQSKPFDAALAHVLRHEGGFVNHPGDPGGATNMGITIGTLTDWMARSATIEDVRTLSREAAAQIYEARYWNAASCDDWPDGVSLMVFDATVNHGPGRAVMFLQQALNIADDGKVGPVTRAAVAGADPRALLLEYAARRMRFYGRLSTFTTFGLGWSRRLMDTLASGLDEVNRRPSGVTQL
jgi:lysozyme family protein